MTTAPVGDPVPVTSSIDLAAYELPHDAPFLCELAVGQGHLGDAIAHVSNVEYVRWLDKIAEGHADSLGYTRERMAGERVMWFVSRHEVDYLAEVWPDDHLVLATWVRTMGRIRSWRDSVVIRPADETVVCRATTLWVFVDLETRRPRRIPREMGEAFGPLGWE